MYHVRPFGGNPKLHIHPLEIPAIALLSNHLTSIVMRVTTLLHTLFGVKCRRAFVTWEWLSICFIGIAFLPKAICLSITKASNKNIISLSIIITTLKFPASLTNQLILVTI